MGRQMLATDISPNISPATKYAVAHILHPTFSDAVEDVLQNARLNAFRFQEQFGGRAKYSTWFHRIAVNQALIYLRSAKAPSRPVERPLANVVLDGAPNPEERAIQSERRQRLAQAIRELPPKLRQAILLCKVEGLLISEVAAKLGLTDNTVKARIHRGMKQLRERLCTK